MLPSSKRLNLKKDFKWVSSGKKIDTNFVTLFLKNGNQDFPKVGIATSSKVFKKAVDRNRARRVVSKAFEDIYESLPKGVNIVALPKTGLLGVKSTDVLSDIKKYLLE